MSEKTKQTQQDLEKAWAYYKYWVMAQSHQAYKEVRLLFKDNNHVNPHDFYAIIDELKTQPLSHKNQINALEHMWGYFKNKATEAERTAFFYTLQGYKDQAIPLVVLQKQLYDLALKYKSDYLLKSYYFHNVCND